MTLKEAIIASIREQAADARAIVFAQASMASLAEDVQRELGIPVFASPDFGFYIETLYLNRPLRQVRNKGE